MAVSQRQEIPSEETMRSGGDQNILELSANRPGNRFREEKKSDWTESDGRWFYLLGVAERMSYEPARIARLAHQGRPLRIGEPANLVLVDASARALVDRDASASKSRNNPYHGRDLPDPVVATVWAGKVTHRR